MTRVPSDHGLETRIETLRRELAAVIVTLCNVGQQLEDVADELRSRREAEKVVAFNRGRRGKRRDDPDILVDFLK